MNAKPMKKGKPLAEGSVSRPGETPSAADAVNLVTGGCAGILADAGIVFQDAAEFVSADITQPDWIVGSFIAKGMKGDLCGSSKTFKTYLGLQLAICTAAGKCFLDNYPVTSPHCVAYINLELFDWNFQERMTAQMSHPFVDDETGELCGGLGIDPDSLRGRLLVCNLRGRADILRDHIEDVVSVLCEKGVEMVIVDPRYKLLKPDEDENTGSGLRGILELRDRLAEKFAVLVVTHDPKGDTSQKKTTDRGAGSYTAGADFDFRLTIDRAEGWSRDNLAYVVEAEGRARKTPPPIGVRFDGHSQVFRVDAKVTPVKQDGRGTTSNAAQRAATETALLNKFRDAALSVARAAGAELLPTTVFDERVAQVPGASLALNRRREARQNLVSQGVLAVCAEMERKRDTGEIGKKKNGWTFISTPELIAAYLHKWEKLPL